MIAYLFTVCLASYFAGDEAEYFEANKPFDHKSAARKKFIASAVAYVFVAICLLGAGRLGWNYLLIIPGMWATFTQSHRIILNHARKLKFYYMGPLIRGPKESTYDTFWIRLAATAQHTSVFTQERTTVRYDVARAWLPWLYCTLFETFIMTLFTWAYFHFTNT